MKNVERKVILKDGSIVELHHDAMECPICVNGSMTVVSSTFDGITYSCGKCQSELFVPFIKCEVTYEDEETVDEGDFGVNGSEKER